MIDFDRIGLGNPSLDYTFLFITLQNQPQLIKKLLQFLKKEYRDDKDFWIRFWVDNLIRLVDEYVFWLNKDKNKSQLLKNSFFAVYDKLQKMNFN